ncbi:hypothetical protein ABEB36_014152 [Hypothenemus hampei]|uniref:Uncharacterized protein n=1 Tax=Hypothenemus hampei TaxID=57062 RepID=A0ABD1E3F9_HYPHA
MEFRRVRNMVPVRKQRSQLSLPQEEQTAQRRKACGSDTTMEIRSHVSKCKQRSAKSKGSIKIGGICPSRILTKILPNGCIEVYFVETHVGHDEEQRTKRLAKSEQNVIVSKLSTGVSQVRIIKDCRRIENETLERINLVTRTDLAYLIKKFNTDRKRDPNDMVASFEN